MKRLLIAGVAILLLTSKAIPQPKATHHKVHGKEVSEVAKSTEKGTKTHGKEVSEVAKTIKEEKAKAKHHVEVTKGEIIKIEKKNGENEKTIGAYLTIKTKDGETKVFEVTSDLVNDLKEGVYVKIKTVDGKVSGIKEIKKAREKKEINKEVKHKEKKQKGKDEEKE